MLSKSYSELIGNEIIIHEIRLQYDINSEKYFGNTDWFTDHGILNDVIDWFCDRTFYDAKEVVNKYGVLEAIKEYEDGNGEKFILGENKDKNYYNLYYFIVHEYIYEKYYEDFEKMSEEESDTEDSDDQGIE